MHETETCPGCGSKLLNSLYTITTDNNLQTKHKRRWKKSDVLKCIPCNIIIPTNPDIKFWNGKEIVRLANGP